MGLIRVYVGIESNSEEGLISLNRRVSQEENRRALQILNDLEIYHSFNLLIFDPEATIHGMRTNVDFMVEFAESPSNFCRADVYAGTPLKSILERQGRLVGDAMAWTYAMRTPKAEMAFRIASTAFAARNFKCDGVANLNMGIRFDAEVMRRFYPQRYSPELKDELTRLSRSIAIDSAEEMVRVLDFVESADLLDDRAVRRMTLEAASRIASNDLEFVAAIKAKKRLMEENLGLSPVELGGGIAASAAGLADRRAQRDWRVSDGVQR